MAHQHTGLVAGFAGGRPLHLVRGQGRPLGPSVVAVGQSHMAHQRGLGADDQAAFKSNQEKAQAPRGPAQAPRRLGVEVSRRRSGLMGT